MSSLDCGVGGPEFDSQQAFVTGIATPRFFVLSIAKTKLSFQLHIT